MAIIVVLGVALLPLVDIGLKPPPRQGKTLTVKCSWKGASAKVMENSVTSIIEGALSGIEGVENVSSESYFGSCRIKIQLKKNSDATAARFQMASQLRQIYTHLPEGVSYPSLTGGEVVNEQDNRNERITLLTYYVNADMPEDKITEIINGGFSDKIRNIEGVERVNLSGGTRYYIELKYDPMQLAAYGITSANITEAIKAYTGRTDIVGDVTGNGDNRMTLYLSSSNVNINEIPVTTRSGDIVYLNNLVEQTIKKREPSRYYRINGLNTINLSIEVAGEANNITISDKLQKKIAEIDDSLPEGLYLTLAYDAAEQERIEVINLITRSALSLVLLLLFVLVTRRQWKYLFVIATTLTINILLAVIIYWFVDLKLHVFSMAGLAVSLSLIIDSTIVMADHYGYYRDRNAFLAIFAAMLTTIGALVTIWFLPENWQNDLNDFAKIICINLAVSLIVALLFVPTLIDVLKYDKRLYINRKKLRRVVLWNRIYHRYIQLIQKRKWITYIVLVATFGWALKIFIDNFDSNSRKDEKRLLTLDIRGELPVGGTARELNQKVVILEDYLKEFREIKHFTTRIDGRGAHITVEFQDSCQNTSAPFFIEQRVIGKVIGIGGADWSTYGVSNRGFSNSLNLQHRSNRIWITGYNYDHVNRYAEDICKYISNKPRVRDAVVRVPDRQYEPDELFMEYNRERMEIYGITASDLYSAISNILNVSEVGKYDNGLNKTDVVVSSEQNDKFDLWKLRNAYINCGDRDVRVSDVMDINNRNAKNCIPKHNQEYVLSVDFNVLGSYSYVDKFIKETIEHFNNKLPLGYRCENPIYGSKSDKDAPYWIIGIVVIVVFFICSILFESIKTSLAIILMIPISFVGIFLVFGLTNIEFGTGGLASMVMLAGIVINSVIYIINENRILIKNSNSHCSVNKLYVKAFNHKISPVFLTIISTVLGLVPFFFDGDQDSFWFSFATGVTGGLLFSIFVVIIVLPVFINMFNKKQYVRHPKRA